MVTGYLELGTGYWELGTRNLELGTGPSKAGYSIRRKPDFQSVGGRIFNLQFSESILIRLSTFLFFLLVFFDLQEIALRADSAESRRPAEPFSIQRFNRSTIKTHPPSTLHVSGTLPTDSVREGELRTVVFANLCNKTCSRFHSLKI